MHSSHIKYFSIFSNFPSSQNFLPRLQSHLLSRLLSRPYTGDEDDFTDEELSTVCFRGNKLYQHKVVRVNYTTYNICRAHDSLNPWTHADFMVLAHEDGNDVFPYWFSHIIGVFHADIVHTEAASKSAEPQQMDFLWVRWFGRDLSHKSGFKATRLHRLGFLPNNEPGAFAFLDLQEII